MVRFDAYTATGVSFKPTDVLPMLFEAGGCSMTQGRGFQTFGERISVKNSAGDELGSVSWGGEPGGQGHGRGEGGAHARGRRTAQERFSASVHPSGLLRRFRASWGF
jgi:hypothetical protein